ncbi:acyl-CoA binding protein 1, partial [Striga asiatica]
MCGSIWRRPCWPEKEDGELVTEKLERIFQVEHVHGLTHNFFFLLWFDARPQILADASQTLVHNSQLCLAAYHLGAARPQPSNAVMEKSVGGDVEEKLGIKARGELAEADKYKTWMVGGSRRRRRCWKSCGTRDGAKLVGILVGWWLKI